MMFAGDIEVDEFDVKIRENQKSISTHDANVPWGDEKKEVLGK